MIRARTAVLCALGVLMLAGPVGLNAGEIPGFARKYRVSCVEDAYVQYNDVAGAPVDVMVGQFQVSDPCSKTSPRISSHT
jgi:hypothetical protein